jgi:hypothetical protein
MKTQISHLRSGAKNQVLNLQIDYSTLPTASSHTGHSGSNQDDVEQVWKQVIAENPESMKILVNGIEVELKASWSLSRESVIYWGTLSKEYFEEKFAMKLAKNKTPSISIQNANRIIVYNGKNRFRYICPSLITIL